MLSLWLEFAEFSLGYYQVRYIFFKEPAENEIVRINTSRMILTTLLTICVEAVCLEYSFISILFDIYTIYCSIIENLF